MSSQLSHPDLKRTQIKETPAAPALATQNLAKMGPMSAMH